MFDSLLAICPLDGRYQSKLEPLQNCFSEFGLVKMRLFVEIKWLIFLCNEIKLPGTHTLDSDQVKAFLELHSYFDIESARAVKEIEKTTNHDVKAVEYYLKEKLAELDLSNLTEFVHFGCTSEDINNTAYALMLQQACHEVFMPKLVELKKQIEVMAKANRSLVMMGRTHGQPASPTTLGKELVNYAHRISQQINKLKKLKLNAKFNGATGNYNAHTSAFPKIDWIGQSQAFIGNELGLHPNLWTTQIEPHDKFAELFSIIKHANTIVLDLATDFWLYISLNYFKQKTIAGEVGSSTMPHKVNPINFENAEGNLELANSIFSFLEIKLMQSRLQRDLSDSTVQRNIGVAFGYSYIAYISFIQGLTKLEVNSSKISDDLEQNWAIIGEALQTIMRREGVEQPYEKLKELTRNKEVTAELIKEFIATLDVNAKVKEEMLKITPHNYSGLAANLVDQYFKQEK